MNFHGRYNRVRISGAATRNPQRTVPRFRQLHCVFCNQIFYQHNALQRHISRIHTCIYCMECCSNLENHECSPLRGLGNGQMDFNPTPFTRIRASLQNTLQVYQLKLQTRYVSVEKAIKDNLVDINMLLSNSLSAYRSVKFQICLKIEMMEVFSRGIEFKYFNSYMQPLLNPQSSTALVVQCANQIIRLLNAFVELASTWTILDIESITINVAKYKPLSGGANIPLPSELSRRKGIANIPVNEYCFNYAAMARYLSLTRKGEIERLSSYTSLINQNMNNEKINFSGLGSYVSVEQIKGFEKKNPLFSVNVFAMEVGDILPMRITNEKRAYHMDLLLYGQEDPTKYHYLYIFDLSLFLNVFKGKWFFCVYCMCKFKKENERNEHESGCKIFGFKKLSFKQPGDFLRVDLAEYSVPSSVTVYFDFESIINKQHGHSNNVEAEVQPIAFGYVIVGGDKVLEYGTYIGPNADYVFVKTIDEIGNKYNPLTQTYKERIITTAEGNQRLESNICCICRKTIPEGRAVRHHNHSTFPVLDTEGGHVIGPAHNSCNLKAQTLREVTFLSHNFAKFDSLQLIKGLSQAGINALSCIARSSSNFITIKFNNCRLIDSYLHLPFSLKECVRILKESDIQSFKCTRYLFSNYSSHFDDIIEKQIYPYEYVTHANIFEKRDMLPPIENFFNSLSNSNITLDEWNHAQKMYKLFNCQSLADYCKIYLLLDITLLCDVMEHHRKVCLDTFRVDPLHFLSTPSMAFKLALGTSDIELHYITCPTIYNTVKASLRGGIVNFGERYMEANCKESENFDETKPTRSIINLDVSQLYSYAMLHKLACGEYSILNESDMKNFDIYEPDIDDDYGYLLTVDVDIDDEAHAFLDNFPIMPEQLVVDGEEASILQQSLTDDMGNSFMKQFKNVQLSLNLYNKKKYVLHLYMLQLYLRLPGIRLVKIHQVIKYRQVAFMRAFIENATQQRHATNDAALKSYFKLLCNSSYGMSGVKIESFIDLYFIKTKEECVNLISRPTFRGFTIVTPGLAILEASPISVLVRNFTFVSSCVLERSKYLIYKHYYFGYKSYFDSINADLILHYSDTDSMVLSVNCHYEETLEHLSNIKVDDKKILDMSFVPSSHKLYSNSMKSMVGTWHSEVQNNIISAIVVLRKKCYALKIEGGEDKCRGKGIQKTIMRSNFCFNTYKDILFSGNSIRVKIKVFRRLNQVIQLICSNKLAFTSFTTSRFLHPPYGINTNAWGNVCLGEGEHEVLVED